MSSYPLSFPLPLILSLALAGCAGTPGTEPAPAAEPVACACEAIPAAAVAEEPRAVVCAAVDAAPEAVGNAEPLPAPAGPPVKQLAIPAGTLLIGEVEHVLLGSELMLQKARIDTGATTTSVGIASLENFERDGEKWVRFTIRDRLTEEEMEFERPLLRTVRIKRHGVDSDRRPVVRMRITMGKLRRNVDVTLNNRDAYDYPVLVGRNFLDGRAIVDVSRKYLTSDSDST
jgi:hypothetical protein